MLCLCVRAPKYVHVRWPVGSGLARPFNGREVARRDAAGAGEIHLDRKFLVELAARPTKAHKNEWRSTEALRIKLRGNMFRYLCTTYHSALVVEGWEKEYGCRLASQGCITAHIAILSVKAS